MVAMVVLTAFAIWLLTYANVARIALPRALDRLDLRAELLATRLGAEVQFARADVLGFRSAVALAGIVRASRFGGVDPEGGVTLDEWRGRMAKRFVAELEAKPLYSQFRFIGVGDGGRELVRVDRSGPGNDIRIVPDGEMQEKQDRRYFQEAVRLRDGEAYVSPIELNQENGLIEMRHRPVLRAAAPVFDADGVLFGIVIVNVDLGPAFERLRSGVGPLGTIYVVNDRGDYLVHPDRQREFGFDLGAPFRIQDEYPGLETMLVADDPAPRVIENAAGERFGMGFSVVRLAGGPTTLVVEAVPYRDVVASVQALREATIMAALVAMLCAIAAAVILARSLTRPLGQMTAAVRAFARGERGKAPTEAGGEIGELARAFEGMAGDVMLKTDTLRRNAEIFDRIMSSMTDAVLLLDGDSRILFANTAAKALFGELVDTGRDFLADDYEVTESDEATHIPQDEWPIVRAGRGESVRDVELSYRDHDSGNRVHVVVNANPIYGDGNQPTSVVVVYRDTTAARESERQLRQSQKMDAIGQLTGGVAHDFNNLLTVIIGSVEMLAENVADRPRLAAAAKRIDGAASRAADLTRQLLAFSRQQPLHPRATDVNALVMETAALLRPTLGEHVEIETMLSDGLWQALIDPSQLSNALINLAVNARDAMPEGGKLTLETDNVVLDEVYAARNQGVAPGSYVLIAVSDTGSGIPPSMHDKVFEPFFTTKEAGKGTGLGLSMVYGLMKQSGGHIKLYSEEGHGTTVKLYMPRLEQASEAQIEQKPAEATGGSETILVVEDDDLVRSFVLTQLANLGYATLSAGTGAEALSLVEQGATFDLLFTDVIMPGGMNGRQLADEIRRRLPATKVLYTSGYTEDAIMHHGRLDPGVILLNKPYRKVDLAHKIREALEHGRIALKQRDP